MNLLRRDHHPQSSAAGPIAHVALGLALLLASGGALAQVSAAAGQSLYTSKGCGGCHGAGVDLQKVRNAANAPGAIARGLGNATMAAAYDNDPMTAAPPAPSAGEQLSLALFIGQLKAPIAGAGTLAVKPGGTATIDVYGLLPRDGTSGAARDVNGLSAGNGMRGTTSASVAASSTAIAYNIAYTATSPTFLGSDSFSYTVTNGTGAATNTVTVTIANTDPPAVSTEPGALASTCDLDFNAKVVASNPPISSYAAEGLPAGLSLDTATGQISGKPQAIGSFDLKLSATNDIGTGSANFPLVIGCPPPVAGGTSLTVMLNTPTTFDMRALISGFAITGLTVVAPPQRGSLAVNGTRVTYTPRRNYFGPDSFSFVAFGAGGVSLPATATLEVINRPDPAQDPDVRGLIAAQADAARRFSQAQLLNIQRRLESLHRSSTEPPAPRSTPPAGTAATAPASTARETRLAANTTADGSSSGAPAATAPAVSALLGLVQTRRIDLAQLDALRLGDSADARAHADGTGAWIGGSVRLGRREGSAEQSGLDFSSSGVTVGFDRRLAERWVLGLGLGLAREEATVGGDGSRNRARGSALAIYGSHEWRPNLFVDAVLGHGPLRMDSRRAVLPIDEVARAERKGRQTFASIALAYDHRDARGLVAPYARFDVAESRLDEASESGAGAYALTYFAQRVPTRRLALGLRAESTHETSFGSLTPRARLEAQHEFEAEGAALLAYVDQAGGPRYTVAPRALERNALVLGLGADLAWRGGLKLAFDYRVMTAGGKKESQSIGLQLSQALGGGAGLAPAGLSALARQPLGLQVDAGLSLDDNVNRGRDGELRLSDLSLRVNVSKDHVLSLGDSGQAALRLTLGGETFRRYPDLARVLAELQAEMRYRASGDFLTPIYSAFARAALENHVSALRDGSRYALGASARVPLTDRLGALATLSRNLRQSRSAVFDLADTAVRLNVDLRASPAGLFYAGLEWRRGDIVSSGRPTLVDLDVAEVFVADGAFGPRELLSYRVDADTWIARVGGNWRLGPDSSLDLSWTRSQSSPRTQPAFVGAPSLRYGADQLRLAYIVRY